MTEQSNKTNEKFRIVSQYIKDLSFETPSSPQIMFEKIEEKPNVEVNVDVKAKKLGDQLFDVALSIKINNKLKDKSLFILELEYNSVVKMETSDKAEEERIILVDVPSLTFPYVREIVSHTTGNSGFPPLLLNSINFEDMFKNREKAS